MSCTCDFGHALKTCHCAQCHASFTGLESFDRHQAFDGEHTICRDPATLASDNGDPVFEAGRRLADGRPIWRCYRPGRPQRDFTALAAAS
jgi:hypothetical protein